MRLAEPDMHDIARQRAEALLPHHRLEAFVKAEQMRVDRALRPRKRARA